MLVPAEEPSTPLRKRPDLVGFRPLEVEIDRAYVVTRISEWRDRYRRAEAGEGAGGLAGYGV